MNKSSLKIFVIFTLTVGAVGAWLMQTQAHAVLGKPGVLVGNQPLYGEKSNLVATTSIMLPEQVPGYRVLHPPITGMELTILPPDTTFGRALYVAPDHFSVQLNTILMGKDRSSLHPPEFCITGQGWNVTSSEVITLPMQKPHPYDLKITKLGAEISVMGKDGQAVEYHGYFLYWFVADGTLTPSRAHRMWEMAREMLKTGTVQRWAYVSYFSYAPAGHESALLERMKTFIQQTLPEFQIAPERQPTPSQVAALN